MIFLGAGASAPFGIPTSPKFTEAIRKMIESEKPELLSKFDEFFRNVYNKEPDFETFLTLLKAYTDPSAVNPTHYMQTFVKTNKQYKENYNKIIEKMYNMVRYHCCAPFISESSNYLKPEELESIFQKTYDSLFSSAFKWNKPFVIFTTNYDPSLELWCQKRNMKCIDGTKYLNNPEVKHTIPSTNHINEINEYKKRIAPRRAVHEEIGLIRLHGSVWSYRRKNGDIIKFNRPKDRLVFSDLYLKYFDESPSLIFPGEEDTLRIGDWDAYYQFFKQSAIGTCLFIGYSFRHSVINEQIKYNLENGLITKLGILAPNPKNILLNLFPGGNYPTKRIIEIPGYFGSKELLDQLNFKWLPDYVGTRWKNKGGILKNALEWKKKRNETYIS